MAEPNFIFSGIINPLFSGLTYKYKQTFSSLLVFARKISAHITVYMLYVKPLNEVYVFNCFVQLVFKQVISQKVGRVLTRLKVHKMLNAAKPLLMGNSCRQTLPLHRQYN